ncbi:pre-peptidase C-terminal domain-containing protein [Pseudoalteromonas luteoviolacea]|uniref:pre-peptidase C-terminal domain-containing protein n=1 Tax=Pseudoalteromonas luteoviolacea TaxID=43657 RepID=UPI001B35FAD0|nr:pre-peptidase C-terminal domain-containing protein [Pseudoalteromonas luteoviolacea]MBQ4835537.1 pre-peptidase C-terminal domain-containing protein [Pseudoalteromonas luteoviolacea]
MRALYLGLTSTILMAGTSYAGSDYHRIIWDGNPSSQATIGFTPAGGSNHVVKYGTNTNESSWATKSVTASHTFDGSLSSQFVKLTGLPADSAIYYRVCDSTGCGQHLWFKTAPNTTSTGFVAIAGGDTRTGWTTRRAGNQMVAKIRPLFIMHGGDYTNANSASEMKEYLKDWQLTFSSDQIDGQSYKRVYPFIATHGNHEDDNYKTLCQVFGVDYDSDGQCTNKDTYGAFNVTNLLRVYTLNSQYKNSGWSSYATAMNNWLKQDLQSQGGNAKWRVAQYHKPMYPHYSGKSDNTILHTWWANSFFDNAMNLVVESDTHINKITEALKPSGSNFVKTTTGGTVYVGEGSWGAPARSANDPKSWTIDLASIQQFKVLSVTPSKMEVRTAQFASSTNTLTREQRAADPLALPNNVNWWYASGLGDVLPLVQSATGLSIIDTPDKPLPNVLENDVPATGLSGAKGSKVIYTMDVPANANQLSFTSSGGTGDVDMYVKFGTEPTTSSYDCRPYKDGNNESCTISTVQTGTYYVMLNGYAAYSGVSLVGSYSTVTNPGNKQEWTDLSANKSNWNFKTFEVPAGTSKLTVKISGGTGDADLYIRLNNQPTTSSYECRPYENGNTETCTITNPGAGTWHLGVRAYETYSGVTLSAEY